MLFLKKPEDTHVVEIIIIETNIEKHCGISQDINQNVEDLRLDEIFFRLKNTGYQFLDLPDRDTM